MLTIQSKYKIEMEKNYMRMATIIQLLKEYILLGIIAILFLGILFFIGYKIIYKKLLKGKKTIQKRKLFLYGISICYIVIVLGAVFLNRGDNYGVINLHLFSSYKEAYYRMEIVLFRNIILNILLFVPLGFLLPFLKDRLKKVYKVVPIGFAVTLIIEIVQYITKFGIFEIDDIFNNTLGVLLGYSIFMIFNSIIKKENIKRVILYSLPIFIVAMAFGGIYFKYQSQEFGNLSYEYISNINMKNVAVENRIDLSNDITIQPIYYKKSLKETETRIFAETFFEKLGTKLSENDIDIYDYSAIYYSLGKNYNLWVDYKDGTYSYTDYSYFETDKDGENKDGEKGASREELENALQNLGIIVPQNAEFREEENKYVFSINLEEKDNQLINGEIICFNYQDGSIKRMKNNLVEYEKVKEKEIISQEEAIQKILDGKFYYNGWYGTIKSIVIENVELQYDLDSKGYYVPVYVFKAVINNQDTTINIKAIR